MKTFDELLAEEFKKLVPYQALKAPEIVAIKNALVTWLKQEGQSTSRCSCLGCVDYTRAMDKAVQSLKAEEKQ